MKTTEIAISLTLISLTAGTGNAQNRLPVFDAHVHYSHDSVEMTPPETVIELMKKAGLKGALVSSSDDKGTQLLASLAPDLIIPGLRPYRRRGELSTWFKDPDALAYVEQRLAKHRYASIGEFHLYGDTADLPIPRKIVQLAAKHNLVLHAHSDADAVTRLFAQNPNAKIIWAHSGFDEPPAVAELLRRFPNLWADLAFRSDMGSNGEVAPAWKKVFEEFPKRLMLGTDTFTPERIYYLPDHAKASRAWLSALPQALAERIAWRNAWELLAPIWNANRVRTPAKEMQEKDKRSAVDCDLPLATDTVVSGKQVRLVTRVLPRLAVSQPFAMQIAVCDLLADTQLTALSVDATMPAHGHGMNYRAQSRRLSTEANVFEVDGLVLHMPGRWQWQFDLVMSNGRERLTTDIELQ